MRISKGINKRLKLVRDGSGLSQEKFGAKVGVGRQHIYLMERGLRNPSQSLLIAIASKYDVDEAWLFNSTNPL